MDLRGPDLVLRPLKPKKSKICCMVKLPKKSRMKFDWKFDWNCQLKLLLKMVRKLLKLIPSIKMTKRQWGRHWKLLGAQKVENMTSLGPKLDKESENSGRKCKKREHFFT